MSKGGGTAKVYFILYLAVVLELLIIIVERDEAEESLMKKQKETMKIVESILSQLQSGAGTEGINTRPQDEITLPPPGIDIKQVMGADIKTYRRYIVEVGVTDISSALKRLEDENEKDYIQRLKKLIELGNVEEIEYQIFFNPSDDPTNPPEFLTNEEILKGKHDYTTWTPGQRITTQSGVEWEFLSIRKLKLDKETTFNNIHLDNIKIELIQPIYPRELQIATGPAFNPKEVHEDSAFFYSVFESLQPAIFVGGQELLKRAFVVNFQPPDRAGWYKLRFSSRTNRILGVRSDQKADELDDETTINIGTVQLTVKDLRKVRKELLSRLEKYSLPSYEDLAKTGDIEKFDEGLRRAVSEASTEEDAADIIRKIRLYGYISKLLAPGMSINFAQNRGAIEFNVRVITPKPPIAEPTVTLPNYTPSFDKIPAVFEFTISPFQSEATNFVEGKVTDVTGATVARIEFRPLDKIAGLDIAPPVQGGRREYRGIIDQSLPPGKYRIDVTHKLGNKFKNESAELEIFSTGLTGESRNAIESRMNALSFYGYPVSIEAIPTSGGKIRPSQFRLYMFTDNNLQVTPIEGLTNTDKILQLYCDAKTVSLRITWIQPYTNTEVDLFPLKTYEIQQEAPEFTSQPQIDYSGSTNKFRVRISGLNISLPTAGCQDRPATVKYKLGKLDKIDGLKTYDPSIEPTIEPEGDGYSILLELSGRLERGERKISGTLNLPIIAWAINPNGKVSEETTYPLTIRINWEPGQGDRPRPRAR